MKSGGPEPLPFNFAKARELLEAAAQARKYSPLPADNPWLQRIETATAAWEKSSKTYIAMLGVSILARATDPNADLTRIAMYVLLDFSQAAVAVSMRCNQGLSA